MRLASFAVKGTNGQRADLGIVALPGKAGGDLPNVNRWREQVGLEAAKPEDLSKLARAIEIGGEPGRLYEQAGQNPSANERSRILAATTSHDGTAFFFKLNGDDEWVAQQKPIFLQFLKSLRFNSASRPAPASAAATVAPSAAGKPKPNWRVPPHWQEVAPGQIQLAKFLAKCKAGSEPEISVTAMGGDGGGTLANVNWWRRQMGLAPVAEADLARQTSPLAVGAARALLFDVASADRKRRLVTVSVPRDGQTWFFKLLGDEPAVAAEKKAFLEFVKSAR